MYTVSHSANTHTNIIIPGYNILLKPKHCHTLKHKHTCVRATDITPIWCMPPATHNAVHPTALVHQCGGLQHALWDVKVPSSRQTKSAAGKNNNLTTAHCMWTAVNMWTTTMNNTLSKHADIDTHCANLTTQGREGVPPSMAVILGAIAFCWTEKNFPFERSDLAHLNRIANGVVKTTT